MNLKNLLAWSLIVLFTAQIVVARPQDTPDVWRSFAAKLDAGSFVEVRLKDRTKVKGYLIEASQEALSLKPKTRVPVPVRSFQFEDIESIQPRNDGWSPAAKVITGTVATIGGVFLLLLTALAVSYD
jgi:hypothetical protein